MATPQKPEVTLIIASSVDGCLIGRESESMDANKVWKDSTMIRGIVRQFFDFSSESADIYNLINAQTMVDLGVNELSFTPKKSDLRLIILDLEAELLPTGIANLGKSVEKLIVIQPARQKASGAKLPSNTQLLTFKNTFDLNSIVRLLKSKFKVNKITVQSAGLLNSTWLASGLVDFLTVILYPLLVGNNGTNLLASSELFQVKPLKLLHSHAFDTNYFFLRYGVINQ